MKQLRTLFLCLSLAPALPAANLGPVQDEGGGNAEIKAGPRVQSVQPAPLAGLWSLDLGPDLAWQSGEDLLSYYPKGAVGAPPTRLYPGFSLSLRRFLSDSFFVGLQASSLPKSYSVLLPGGVEDTWTLDGLMAGVDGGWLLYRAVSVAFYAEAGIGWAGLINGGLERSGPVPDKGSLEGSALSEQFSLGALWFILPSVALEAQGGVRFARIPVSVSSTRGGKWTPPNGPEFYADLGGPFARLGLAFFWGLANPWGEQEAPSAPPPPEGSDK